MSALFYGDRMRRAQHSFPGNILLFDIGDVHRGDSACNVDPFKKVVSHVQNISNAYWISTGDLMNVALKNSKSDVYNSDSLQKEYEALLSELAPISKKCLGIVKSNHHSRFDRETGMSLDKLLARELNIPFLGGLGLINITCGRTSYFLAMHHGTGGGKMRGSKTNNTEALSRIVPGADLYIEGHTHSYDSFNNLQKYIDRKRGLLSESLATFLVTGHFLNWDESYAVDKKFYPMPQGAAFAELFASNAGNNSNKKIKCDLFY